MKKKYIFLLSLMAFFLLFFVVYRAIHPYLLKFAKKSVAEVLSQSNLKLDFQDVRISIFPLGASITGVQFQGNPSPKIKGGVTVRKVVLKPDYLQLAAGKFKLESVLLEDSQVNFKIEEPVFEASKNSEPDKNKKNIIAQIQALLDQIPRQMPVEEVAIENLNFTLELGVQKISTVKGSIADLEVDFLRQGILLSLDLENINAEIQTASWSEHFDIKAFNIRTEILRRLISVKNLNLKVTDKTNVNIMGLLDLERENLKVSGKIQAMATELIQPLKNIAPEVSMALAEWLPEIQGKFQAQGAFNDPKVSFTDVEVKTNGKTAVEVNLGGEWSKDSWKIQSLEAMLPEKGRLKISQLLVGDRDFSLGEIDGEIDLKTTIANFVPLLSQGRVRLSGLLKKGQNGHFKLDVLEPITLGGKDSYVLNVPKGEIDGHVENGLVAGTLALDGFHGEASWSWENPLKVKINEASLSKLGAPLRIFQEGKLSGEAQVVFGPKFLLTSEFNIADTKIAELFAGNIFAGLTVQDYQIKFSTKSAQLGESTYLADGIVKLPRPDNPSDKGSLQIDVSSNGFRATELAFLLKNIIKLPISDGESVIRGQISGGLENDFGINLRLVGRKWKIFGETIDRVLCDFGKRGRYFSIDRLRLSDGNQDLAVATMALDPQGPFTLQADVLGVPLKGMKFASGLLNGSLSGRIVGSGVSSSPVITGKMKMAQVKIGDKVLGDLRGEFNFRNKRISADLETEENTKLKAFYEANVQDVMEPFELNITTHEMEVAPLVGLVIPSILNSPQLQSMMDGEVMMRGFQNPASIQELKLNLKKLLISDGQVSLTNLTPIEFVIENNQVQHMSFNLILAGRSLPETKINASCVRQGEKCEGKVIVPLQILPIVSSTFERSEGTLTSDFRFDKEGFNATVGIQSAQIKLGIVPQVFLTDKCLGTMKHGEIHVDDCRFKFSDGYADVKGTIRGSAMDLTAVLNSVKMSPLEQVYVQANGELKLKGDKKPWLVSGKLDFENLLYTREFNIGGGVQSLTQTRYLPKANKADQSIVELNVLATSPGTLTIRNSLADLSGGFNLNVRGDAYDPVLEGKAQLVRGRISAYVANFMVNPSTITFHGDSLSQMNPDLFVQLNTNVNNYNINVLISGAMKNYQLNFTSSPPLSKEDTIALITTGAPRGDGSNQAGAAANIGLGIAANQIDKFTALARLRKRRGWIWGVRSSEVEQESKAGDVLKTGVASQTLYSPELYLSFPLNGIPTPDWIPIYRMTPKLRINSSMGFDSLNTISTPRRYSLGIEWNWTKFLDVDLIKYKSERDPFGQFQPDIGTDLKFKQRFRF